MELSPVLSPSGEPIFTAGGKTAWKVVEYRGFAVSFEWAKRRRKFIALMVIWRPGNVLQVGAVKPGMWAISRNVITEFVGFDRDGKCTGSGNEHLYREARASMEMLGMDVNDKQGFLGLVDTVIRFAPDLVLMPAAPRVVKAALTGEAMWDVSATHKNTGKTINEASI